MTDFPYIGGIEVSAIKNREFIRIETDKAQAIVVALDKSNIPFSARFGDAEMVLTYDGSYKDRSRRSSQRHSPATMKHCSVSCKFTECLTAIIDCSVKLRSF